MATFSVKTGGSASYGASLKLDITQGTQNIANNTTVVNYRLYLSRDGGNSQMWANGAYRRTVTVDGTSVVNTTGNYSLSGSSEYTLASGSRTVTHNSNGTKTVTVSGSFTGIAIHGGTTNISGSLALTTIPRASELTAFSFASSIKPSTAVTINYTVSRKNSGFRHDVTLLDGSTTLGTWTGQNSDKASTVSLPWQNVNTLLNRMSNVTSKTLTLRVQTKSGSTNIGSAVSRTASVQVSSTVKPTVSTPTLQISGSGADKTMGLYVQSISKVSVSSSGSANGGASLNGISVTVRRKTSNTDTQVINTASGTTKNPVSLNGTYEAFATATDSRGRTSNSPTIDFTVQAYTPPVVSVFTADRLSDDASIVSVYSLGGFSSLSSKNTLTISIQRRTGTGAWSTMGTNTTSKTGSYVRSQEVYNNNVVTSYEYRVLITDTFGNEAVSTVSVATQKVLFEFNEDKGIGIGKRHEQGILDVDGDVYVDGTVFSQKKAVYYPASPAVNLNNILDEWALVSTSHPNTPPPSGSTVGHFYYLNTFQYTSTVKKQIAYGYQSTHVFTRQTNGSSWSDWKSVDRPERGANSNGHWIRFNDGTQICQGTFSNDFAVSQTYYQTMSNEFVDLNYFVSVQGGNGTWQATENASQLGAGPVTNNHTSSARIQRIGNVTTRAPGAHPYRWFAVGRWY